ncbi:nitroreductase family protein, partial [bacterium]|nr:nitroreductase family protein [bacterium]
QKREIDKDTLDKIIEAGIRAPTSGNLQPYSIILARDAEKKSFIAKVTSMKFIEDTDLLMFFILDFARLKMWAELNKAPFGMGKSFRHFLTSVHDVLCCAQNVVIAAESFGIGSVYIGRVIELYQELKKILNLPKLTFPIALLCLGYPDKRRSERTPRLSHEAIVHSEAYQQADDEKINSWFDEKYKGKRIKLSDKSKWLYLNVIRTALGERKYREAVKELDKTPSLNLPQYFFGIQYPVHVMPKIGYMIKLDLIEAGFECFRDEF